MKTIKFIPHDLPTALSGIAPKPSISLLPDWYKGIQPRHTKKKLHQHLLDRIHLHFQKFDEANVRKNYYENQTNLDISNNLKMLSSCVCYLCMYNTRFK